MSAPRPTIFVYDSLGSTLDEAQALAKTQQPPFFIFAKEQTKGRGRMGRTWHSPEGNIYFTACLDAKLPPAQMALFTLYGALKVCKALNRLFGQEKLWVKWPNDIWAGRKKKCAGLLAECVSIRGKGKVLLLGMGLNVETKKVPEDIRKTATSLKKVFGRTPRLSTLENLLCREILAAYHKFIDGNYEDELYALWDRYGKLIGRTLSFEHKGKQVSGKAVGLAPDGALCVKTTKEVVQVRSGEVSLSAGLR